MKFNTISLILSRQPGLLVMLVIIIACSACLKKSAPTDPEIKKKLEIVDSLNVDGKTDTAKKLLFKIRPAIHAGNPDVVTYYCLQAEINSDNVAAMNLYADSALAIFNNEKQKSRYPRQYFQALLIKGEASMRGKKYITALNYFYQCRKVLSTGGIPDNGDLAGKMGYIYYSQKNFGLAAKYWAENYHRVNDCKDSFNVQKLFFSEQGALNNAGYSYEKAGLPDSANRYYLEDVKMINHADSGNQVAKQFIIGARSVVYDNLGGLNIQFGNYHLAEDYLRKCLALNITYNDGVRIPPLLKLAEIYLKTGEVEKAATKFLEARSLLNRFLKDNPEANIKYYNLYARYLFKINKPAEAYQYLDAYVRLRDSTDNTSAEIYRLNVEQELNVIKQNQELTNLERQAKERKLYFAAAIIILVLMIVITVMITGNLSKTRKNHWTVTQQNQQLQHTLAELERVNKNYIRMMRVMAHDLKNPLAGITGLAAMLLEEESLNDENRHILELIQTTGSNSMEMISELLRSGLADDDEKLIKQRLDLNALVYDSVELLRFKAVEKKQQLIFESKGQPIMADVSHEKIWRVINNLIVNAIKFSYPEGLINVSIEELNNQIVIAVKDSGVGIPDDQKDYVFDMFTSAKKPGTSGEEPFGLGLSISKKIVEKHGGHIWFESAVGKGTTFYVELPAAF